MANDIVVRAENLGKKYVIGHQFQRERYVTLRDVIARSVRTLGRTAMDLVRGRPIVVGDELEEIWAFKDVSFEIKRGEVMGVIGPNGAGKSTLLKILSRITEPTEGRVTIKGRVASLLEVGTGFHPELTGRENILLNGTILGMTRKEIKAKSNEIVDFAGVDKFLDTPVKRYSSGMYVRLAFAVAAHLESDILIVDEVLAVGDAEFQKKCLGKMSDVARGGRTVLFVSHNMGSVATLCQTALLLDHGRLVATGTAQHIVDLYGNKSTSALRATFSARPNKPSITSVSLDEEALRKGDFSACIEFVSPFPMRRPVGGLIVYGPSGVPVWGTNGRFHASPDRQHAVYRGTLTCNTRSLPLVPSLYTVSVWLSDWHQEFDEKLNAVSFDFKPDSDISLRPSASAVGYIDWHASWQLEPSIGDNHLCAPNRVTAN